MISLLLSFSFHFTRGRADLSLSESSFSYFFTSSRYELDLPSTFCFLGSAGLEESNFLFPRFFCPQGNKKKSARERKVRRKEEDEKGRSNQTLVQLLLSTKRTKRRRKRTPQAEQYGIKMINMQPNWND